MCSSRNKIDSGRNMSEDSGKMYVWCCRIKDNGVDEPGKKGQTFDCNKEQYTTNVMHLSTNWSSIIVSEVFPIAYVVLFLFFYSTLGLQGVCLYYIWACNTLRVRQIWKMNQIFWRIKSMICGCVVSNIHTKSMTFNTDSNEVFFFFGEHSWRSMCLASYGNGN